MSTPQPAEGTYQIGTRVVVAGQIGSVIAFEEDNGWIEVDFDVVGQQWVETRHASPRVHEGARVVLH